MARLLVIEDKAELQQTLKRGLEEEGYEVVAVGNGAEAERIALSHPFDAVLLDLMLPDRDGLQILRQLRKNRFEQPVLIITARDAVEDRVSGLDSGADDYLAKPFAFAELLARLRALLRRNASPRDTVLRVDDLELNLVARTATRGGTEVPLTHRQFELLACLLRHKNETVTRDILARDVWKETTATWTNVIEVQINQLRKRIERPDKPALLHTVRGVGYVIKDVE